MTDIALSFPPGAAFADLSIIGGDLATDDGLRTAVVISLFTDARALDDDVLPDDGADRRGWWGDCANADVNDRIGSRLWLLERAKVTQATALRARDMIREALAWLIADGIARTIEISATLLPVSAARVSGGLAIGVTIVRPSGARQAVDFLWDAEAGRIERNMI